MTPTTMTMLPDPLAHHRDLVGRGDAAAREAGETIDGPGSS
jgi:hypothetical protein